jgi:hypothetical protein
MLLLYWGVRALGIVNHLRRRFARFKLGAHLLKARCQGFDLLVLLRLQEGVGSNLKGVLPKR